MKSKPALFASLNGLRRRCSGHIYAMAITLAGALGNVSAEPFLYDICIDTYKKQGDLIIVDALVRVQGESHTKIQFSSKPETPIRSLFESKHHAGNLEYSYFRIETKTKIPKALPARIYPRLDIITKDVLTDIHLNEEHHKKTSEVPSWMGM